MRTVDAGVITALDSDRQISASATVFKTRLVFAEKDITAQDSAIAASFSGYDMEAYGTGVLRVANLNGTIWFQYVSNLAAGTWPSWASSGRTCDASMRPSIASNGWLYYTRSSTVYKCQFNGTSFGTEVSTGSSSKASNSIAGIDSDEYYLVPRYQPASTVGSMAIMYGNGSSSYEGQVDVFTEETDMHSFDAVRLGSADYVFFSDGDDKRAHWTVRRGTALNGGSGTISRDVWADPKPVVPLDVVDTLSYFSLYGAQAINGMVFVTGILSRPGGFKAQVFMMGPPFTAGREMYIGTKGTVPWEDPSLNTYPAYGGKLHISSTTIWYIGPGYAYYAPASSLVGVSNSALEYEMLGINEVRFTHSYNDPSKLTLRVTAADAAEALLVPGNELELFASISGNEAKLGRFAINAVSTYEDGSGDTHEIGATGLSVSKLARWIPDANYEFSSQIGVDTNPANLTQLVRHTGQWSGTSYIQLDELNSEGYLYSVASPVRSSHARGKFQLPSASGLTGRFGIAVNFRRNANGTMDGLFVIYSATEASGSPGFGIWKCEDDTWTHLVSTLYTIPTATDFWIEVEFHDGYLRILYRLASSTTWSVVYEMFSHTEDEANAWPDDDYRGRWAIYIENMTANANTDGFHSTSDIIPVDNTDVFTVPLTVLVDDEQISVDAKTTNFGGGPQGLDWMEGFTLNGASHWSGNPGGFNGFEIYFATADSPVGADFYDDFCLVCVDGPGKGMAYKITDYDYQAPDQWVDTGGPYTLPETWMDHVGDLAYGYWDTPSARRVFVSERPTALGDGSVCDIERALHVASGGRGAGGTLAISHGAGVVSKYVSGSVKCYRFEAFSADVDMCIEDALTEVCAKAGVTDIAFQLDASGSLVGGPSGNSSSSVQRIGTAIGKISLTWAAGAEAGMYTKMPSGDVLYTVTLSDTYVTLYDGNSMTLIERIPLAYTPSGDITISIQGTHYSVWVGGRFVHTFVADSAGWQEAGFYAKGVTANYALPAMDTRVEYMVLDMGKTGMQNVGVLVNERRIFFIDDQDGGLKFFRTGDTVNQPSAYVLAVSGMNVKSDVETATRIRVEGGEVSEVVDYDALQKLGNLFAMINLQELITSWDVYNEANNILTDVLKNTGRVRIVGAGDPRVEPRDIYYVTLPSGTTAFTTDRVSYMINVTDDGAIFDMDLESRYKNASIT